ncbi:MAG: HEAT repeat domain-containing protein [Candidatus Thorarchaeota archaeon]
MTRPQLRLLSTPPRIENYTPLYVDVDSARLWNLVNDETVHLVLRKPALQELARRRDPQLMDYCEVLLSTDDYEEWLTAISTLVALGTPEAVDRLIIVYAQSLNEERRLVLSMVARVLTADHVKPFSIMVREVAVPGELDVSGWTKTAVSTLQDVCKRFGIEVHGVYVGSEEEISTLNKPTLDEMSTIPKK